MLTFSKHSWLFFLGSHWTAEVVPFGRLIRHHILDSLGDTLLHKLYTICVFPYQLLLTESFFVMHTQSTYCVCLRFASLSFTSQTDVDYDPFVEPYHSRLLTSLCTCSMNRNAIISSEAFTFNFLITVSRPESQTVCFILLLFRT